MKIPRIQLINLMKTLGYSDASTWTDAQFGEKLPALPTSVENENQNRLLTAIRAAIRNGEEEIMIVGSAPEESSNEPRPAEPGQPASKSELAKDDTASVGSDEGKTAAVEGAGHGATRSGKKQRKKVEPVDAVQKLGDKTGDRKGAKREPVQRSDKDLSKFGSRKPGKTKQPEGLTLSEITSPRVPGPGIDTRTPTQDSAELHPDSGQPTASEPTSDGKSNDEFPRLHETVPAETTSVPEQVGMDVVQRRGSGPSNTGKNSRAKKGNNGGNSGKGGKAARIVKPAIKKEAPKQTAKTAKPKPAKKVKKVKVVREYKPGEKIIGRRHSKEPEKKNKRKVIPSIVEILRKAGEEKRPILKPAIVGKLKKLFPERPESSLKCTVGQQVPCKLRKEQGLRVRKNELGYWL